MKPAPFDLVAATSVEQAVAALSSSDAMVLAGGQSLVPLLALRRRRPRLLVDVNRLPLDHVELDPTPDGSGGSGDGVRSDAVEGVVRVGALVRHRRLERDPVVAKHAPLLADASGWIGSPAIRRRGTLGGSLAHAEPAAELPAALVALGGEVVVQGPARPPTLGGQDTIAGSHRATPATDPHELRTGPSALRTMAAADFFVGPHRTALAADELVIEVRVPTAGPGHGAAFCEWAARHNDLPDAGVALALVRDPDGVCVDVRAAACGVATTPLPLAAALEPALGEADLPDNLLRKIAARVAATALGCDAIDDHRRDDRAELAGLLAARALWRAFERARSSADEAA